LKYISAIPNRFGRATTRVVLDFAYSPATNPRIFDYGGNVGNVYYSYSPRLLNLGDIVWTVFDIPFMLENGRRIAAERKAAALRFVDSPGAFESDQILLVSGAFHYWEKDISAFLQQFNNPPNTY
jgi:putative methyltransferase (TIGR04325 family)